MGVMGSRYTWKGHISNGLQCIYERVNMDLCNDSWRFQFPDGFLKVLPRLDFSDDHPFLIFLHGIFKRVTNPFFLLESACII